MRTRILRCVAGALAGSGGAAAWAQSDVTALGQVTVVAGQFPTGETPGSVLNTLEIVTTPGAQADINRALQTLPGVQLPDEGNALFVRGGDSFETVTVVNGIRFPTATHLDDPSGTFQGTINPFEAQRVDFQSGGFGAQFGNALSGVVDLDTVGAPAIHGVTIGGGLGALSVGGQQPIGEDAGIRVEGTFTDTAPIFRLNGSSQDFPDPPHGHDFALEGSWDYRPGAELRWFAVEQTQGLGLLVDQPYLQGEFRENSVNRLGTLSWKDQFGAWTPQVSVGASTLDQQQTVANGVDTETYTRSLQYAAHATGDLGDRVEVTVGSDGAEEYSRIVDEVAPTPAFAGGTFTELLPGAREGLYAQVDALVAPTLRAVAGARLDHSSLTGRTTTDPRLALAWKPRPEVSVSVAGGLYHQIPDPYDFVGASGRRHEPPMKDASVLAGLQVGGGETMARVEVYSKAYHDLVTLDRRYLPVPGGAGQANGADLILKSALPGAFSGRLTYSFVDSRRTDPNTGAMARTPFDVTHTAALLVNRSIGRWVASAALRYASGRPVTPIEGGVPDGEGGYQPVYGPPDSVRLPQFVRVDLNASRYWRFSEHRSLVVYVAVTNLLNRGNVYDFQYSADYSQRKYQPSLFKRTIYLGFSLQFN